MKKENIVEKIIEAKEIFGEKAIPEIVAYYKVENFDEETKKGCCPFHTENTPSFIWNKKDKAFKCFSCGKRVSILDMYVEVEGSYIKAVKRLCEETNVDIKLNVLSSENADFFANYKYPEEEETKEKSNIEDYLSKRGISKETIDYMDIRQDKNGNVAFSLRDFNGVLLCKKYRLSSAPKTIIKNGKKETQPKMWWDKNSSTCPVLYNMHKIDITKPLIITEGFMDCISVVEAGLKNVVSIPGGAEDTNWIEFNYEFLEHFNEIILWFDNDPAGQKGLQKTITRLGEYRCKVVKPEQEQEDKIEEYYKHISENLSVRKTDANNILLACGKSEINYLIDTAKDVPIDNIIDLMTTEEFDIENTGYLPTGIAELDSQIHGYIDGSVNIWTAYSGVGKSLVLDSDLLTENGYIKMYDVKLNQKIYGDDGSLHSVTGVYPQGKLDVWKVTFSDDTFVKCSEDHLWTIKIQNKSHNSFGGIYTKTLKEIMEKEELYYNTKSGKKWNIFIPMCSPIEFNKKDLPINPYLLGTLIGDGSFCDKGCIGFSNTEKDVICKVQSFLPEDIELSDKKNNKDYTIIDCNKNGKKNRFKEKIQELHLVGIKSYDKFIPENYKFSCIEDRIDLLRGLIDTDGEVIRGAYYYSSTSLQLIKDIEFIVNTLGGTATYSHRTSSYTNPDGTRNEKEFDSYRIYIKMPRNIILFSSQKHKSKYKEAQTDTYRSIRSIEYVGKEDCQCISIDSPSKLYLTNNCIVTHNTTMIAQSCVLEAIDKGETVFWFNAESTTGQMLNWILSQAASREHMIEFSKDNGFSFFKPTLDATKRMKSFYLNKILVYDNLLLSSPYDILDKMKYVYKKRGTRVFILDNWLCMNFRGKADVEVTGAQVDFMNELIHFSKRNDLQIHLVAHPRKPQTNVPLTEYDILGTSNVVNMADRIYGLEKVWDTDLKNRGFDRQFTVFKDRILGTKGLRIGLYYDKVTRRLYSESDDMYKKYSWDDQSIKYITSNFGNNGLLVGRRILDSDRKEVDYSGEKPY